MNTSQLLKCRMGLVSLATFLCEKDLRFLLWKLLVASTPSFLLIRTPNLLIMYSSLSFCVPGKDDKDDTISKVRGSSYQSKHMAFSSELF